MSEARPYVILVSLMVATLIAASVSIQVSEVKWVFLWTDVLVYVLVTAVVLFALQAQHKEHLRAPWRHVARRPLAMSALVVLVFYVGVGLLDSVHFRQTLAQQAGETEVHYSGEVLSLLDVMLTRLRTQQEKTYSAPLATHLFAKEVIETPQGQVRDYPRLKYGGAQLTDPASQKTSDILQRVLQSALTAILVFLILVYLLANVLAKRRRISFFSILQRIRYGQTELPWRSMLLTFFILLLLAMITAGLSSNYHVFGTDKVGQDVLYLAVKSIRTGLVIGTLTTLIMLPFAIMLGIMAGHFRGWIDDVIQYIYTTLNSIPGVLLIAAAILSLQVYMANNPEMYETVTERADLRLLFLCIILGITSWTGLCRLLRGETFKLSEMDYIEAANAFGVGHGKIILRHILPNVMHIVLISVVLDFSGLVLAEAVLSYVGVGVDPITISWGNMINSARLEMARDPIVWWSLVAAFVFMFVLVLAANLFSDAVRDAFDPRITRSK